MKSTDILTKRHSAGAAAVFLPLLMASAAAQELGAPFADHAILQRQAPIPVWGWSKPGTEVSVEFAGQKQSAKAAENGKWTVSLTPLEASAEPREMTITESGGASRTLKDILVGEVWMASGQSNMQWLAGKSSVGTLIKPFIEKGEKPPIREFKISNMFAAPHPVERATGSWKFDNYADYSAIAFAFAHKIYREIGVPVVPYAIRGAIWNQGYANIQGGINYYQNLHSLIRGWRLKWGNPALPVYFNQFYCPDTPTGFDHPNPPGIKDVTEMRLGTWMARDIPHTIKATQTHNVCVYSFIPERFKGIIFLSVPEMVKAEQGKNFGPELSALANGWIRDFGGKAKFIYTMPGTKLAPGITAPEGIQGEAQAIEIQDWADLTTVLETITR